MSKIKEPPIITIMRFRKRLLEVLMELGVGKYGFTMLKPQTIADCLSERIGKKVSAKKVTSTIRLMFGDYVIEERQNRYFVTIHIDSLEKVTREYNKWDLEK